MATKMQAILAVSLKRLIRGSTKSPERIPVPIEGEEQVSPPLKKCALERILELPVPHSLRNILRINKSEKTLLDGSVFVVYDDLVSWSKKHREDDRIIHEARNQPHSLLMSEHSPTLIVDLSAIELYEGPMPSFDILPYLFVYMCCPWIQFFAHGHAAVEPRVAHFFNEIVLPNEESWRQGVAQNKWIKEVRLFCDEERTLDLVLEPDSDWARDWNCIPEINTLGTDKIRVYTVCLGLNLRSWRGHVVVGSVEGASL